jgi:hypothetical protein
VVDQQEHFVGVLASDGEFLDDIGGLSGALGAPSFSTHGGVVRDVRDDASHDVTTARMPRD